MAECQGKKSWLEVVRENGEAAAAKIEQENQGVRAIVLLEGSATSKDWTCDRIWVWVNQRGVVTRVPRVG